MNNKSNRCLSCETILNPEDRYCPKCGLETVYRNLSIGFLIKSFFEAFLNFDVKMLHSIRDIWIPNKITKTFLEGKREYHVHPFRFYFICLVLFFALLSVLSKDIRISEIHMEDQVTQFELYQKYDTLSSIYSEECEVGVFDSIKIQLYKGTRELDRDTFIRLNTFNSDIGRFGISTFDAFRLDNDEIFEKYEVENKWDKHSISQFIKVAKNPESAIRFVIANMIWGLILLTVVMAFFLHMIYVRHESYYIEHLLHISNFHCISLLLYSLLIAAYLLFPSINFPISLVIIFLGTVLYLVVSLKSYYGEKIIKTILKMFLLSFLYFLSISMIVGFIAMISLVVF